VASPEAAVGEPSAALNGAATACAPAAAPGEVVVAEADDSDTALEPASAPEDGVASAMEEVTSTAAVASAPNKTSKQALGIHQSEGCLECQRYR